METTRLSAKLDRDLMAVDQKIERQNDIIEAANRVLPDLFATRAALLAAHEVLHRPVQQAAE